MKITRLQLRTTFLVLMGCFIWGSASAAPNKAIFENGVRIGGAGGEDTRFNVTDKEGNTYLVGAFATEVKFGEDDNALTLTGGAKDFFLVKYDKDLNVSFAVRFGGSVAQEPRSVKYDADGNVYVTGYFSQNMTVTGADEEIITPKTNGQDGFILKFDAKGKFLQSWVLGGEGNDCVWDITLDNEKNIHIIGCFRSTVNFGRGNQSLELSGATATDGNIFVAKYTPDMSSCVWAKKYSNGTAGLTDEGKSILVDAGKNVFIAGNFRGTEFKMDDQPALSSGAANQASIFMAKLNSSGMCQWAQGVKATAASEFRQLVFDNAGNILAGGFFQGTIQFSNYSFTATTKGDRDIIFAKYTPDGTVIWANGFGGTGRDEVRGITIDSKNDVYIGGCFNATVDFEPEQNGAAGKCVSKGGYDGYVAKYNGDNGALLWVSPYGAKGNDSGWGIGVDKEMNIFHTGYFNGTTNLIPGDEGSFEFTTRGGYDVYVAKYSQSLAIKTLTLPDASKNESYYTAILVDNAVGNVAYRLSQGQLPEGLELSSQGIISGKPVKAEQTQFTIEVKDDNATKTKNYTLKVVDTGCNVWISPSYLPPVFVLDEYNHKLTANNAVNPKFSITTGALPSGIVLGEDGQFSGRASGNDVDKFYDVIITVKDEAGCSASLDMRLLISSGSDEPKIQGMTSLSFYPVPADDFLHVEADFTEIENVTVELRDIKQSLLYSSKVSTDKLREHISVMGYPTGYYTVTIVTEKGVQQKVIIIK